jgi:uncharacterized protein
MWKEEREKLLKAGSELADHLRGSYALPEGQQPLSEETLEQAAMGLAQSYDWKNGGWGRAPKFPQPMAIEFLLMRAAKGDRLALDIATHALRAMAKGGMYDVVGGGFARYSTDNEWLVPHFEKMLYDNAQLALAYLHGYLLTGKKLSAGSARRPSILSGVNSPDPRAGSIAAWMPIPKAKRESSTFGAKRRFARLCPIRRMRI